MTQKCVSRENDTVFLQKDGRIMLLNIRDIIYIEHRSRTIFLHTIKGVFLMPYMKLCDIHENLGNDFLYQCHKSFLVNWMYVDQFVRSQNVIILKDYFGNVAVGRHYRKAFLENMHYI
ncbi:MAG: LytR/AlgR family response regulator transcription factor [Eubacterium sp.]